MHRADDAADGYEQAGGKPHAAQRAPRAPRGQGKPGGREIESRARFSAGGRRYGGSVFYVEGGQFAEQAG